MQKIFRVLIIIAMVITAYLLVLAWQRDYSGSEAITSVQTATPISSNNDVPTITTMNDDVPVVVASGTTTVVNPVEEENQSELITVTTDRYEIEIDPNGGDIVKAALYEYDATLDSDTPFILLDNSANHVYVAQSGLIGADGIDTDGRAQYQYESNKYVLTPGSQTLSVPLTYQQGDVTITKTFTFTVGQYPIAVNYHIDNAGTTNWEGSMYAQLKRDDSKDPGMADKGALSMATYLGGAWGTPDEDYNKLKFSDFDEPLNVSSSDGWVAIVQHYFVSAWTPENFIGNFFTTDNGDEHIIGMVSQPFIVQPNVATDIQATLYAGPKDQESLSAVAVGLNKTVDYGILWPISKVLFALLDGIHNLLQNWGWSIIVLTILVKISLMWFSNKSYYSMAKMRALAPRLAELKEEHGEDRMRMSQEMMAMYKEEKVNPMAGCLPILLQMPIFLALYWVLVESVELRHAGWILWIHDLSSMDPYFILPMLMGGSMFAQQMFSPQPTDPMQAKVMKFLPVIFTVFMLFFPAGLVLYWTVNNLFTMTQQYIVNKKVEKEQKRKTEKVLG